MDGFLTLNELLSVMNIDNADDGKGREVYIPLEVVEQIKRESPKRQSIIIRGLLKLSYEKVPSGEVALGNNEYAITFTDRVLKDS